MKCDQALGAEFQVRAAANGLPDIGAKTLEAEYKIPSQKALSAVHQLLRYDKMRLVEGHKHVAENALHPGQAADFVEWVFEVGLGCVEIAHSGDVSGLQVFKKKSNPGDCLPLWRHICRQQAWRRRSGVDAHDFGLSVAGPAWEFLTRRPISA